MNLELLSEINNWIGEHLWGRAFRRNVRVAVLLVAGLTISGFYFWTSQSLAAVGTVRPDGDITKTFASCAGTNCATDHYTAIDEVLLDNADYITTGSTGSGGEEEEYTMTSVAGTSDSVSQVSVKFWAYSATMGSDADTISVRIFIDGSYQTAQTVTMTGANALHSVAFTGSWTGDDDLQVELVRNELGSDLPSANDDDVRIYQVYSEITYAPTVTLEQSSYRFFANSDSLTASSALAGQDTAATLSAGGSSFRLRTAVHVGTSNLALSGVNFKLQFAGKGAGSCAAPSGAPASYTDVTSSTTIRYANNASVSNGVSLTTSANDPVHSGHTMRAQSYVEASSFTNSVASIAAGEDGLWDLALQEVGAPTSTTYCLRVVQADGTALNTYSFYPEITTASSGNIAFVKQTTNKSTVAAASETFSATSSTGNTLILMASVAAGSTARLTGVSDSAGNVWVVPGAGQNQNPPSNYVTGSNSYFAMAYALNATAITSVTLTISAVDDFGFNLSEFSGIVSASAVDQSASAGSVAALSHSTPTIATTNANNLIIGGLTVPTATRTLNTAGYTALTDWITSSANGKGSGAYQIVSATNNYSINWNISASQAAGTGIMAFKGSGANPTPTPTPGMEERIGGGNWWLNGVRQNLHLD